MALALRRRLEEELKQLDYELRTELPKELQRAAALGDLRENGEYESARNRQDYLRLRIAAVRKRLGDISMLDVDRLPRDRVGYGSRVELYDLDREVEVTYSIVMSEDADADAGRISTSSPIGKSLLNKIVGDEVEVRIPNGVRRFEVIGLKTLHDIEAIETDAKA
ncbi:MAG: transcription elongation factor GreA [Blastocatellia bacterium]|nr:transcription elongation factor GreA [Blastocatellia bacterium]